MSSTVSQKMGVNERMRAFLLNAPQSALNVINLPSLDVGSALQGEFDYLHFFTKTQAESPAFHTRAGPLARGRVART